MADLAGTENRKGIQNKKQKTPTPTAQEKTPATEVAPKLPCGAIPSEDVPANRRTRRIAQKMKKLRSLHSLHVPPCKSKTR